MPLWYLLSLTQQRPKVIYMHIALYHQYPLPHVGRLSESELSG